MNNNIVYKYTNIMNNKVYIGRTSQTIKQRAGKNGNGYNTCSRFWNAICKYGWNNFVCEVLKENLSFDESVDIERYYIELYKSYDDKHGYNILKQEPGNGPLSEETKEKIRKAHYNVKECEHKNKQDKGKYVRTKEHCQHISESLKGIIPWNKGLKTGPLKKETKDKMSNIRKGNKNSIHIPIKNITTGEIFRSGAEAGKSINCTAEAIFSSIKESRPCKGNWFERVYEEIA